ncbi:hypothetical protein IP92_01518 [Pseudoduganella flava]|uniref:Uncharacterized protein n=1 Tax=Pseudoduganella flava TaxID=871742 RepID=A0A562Q0U2_9BURK|nr:hypothetical protein [Pseudoduganella flava]QGZ38186.1 hypothetical protein GO485_03395 [Pseudoduganella flava]TWI50289.1 hypothetical protein IP92_01518 [Pseudoduganella flava]
MSVVSDKRRRRFLVRWIGANALAELLGLGTVAVVGYVLVRQAGAALTVSGVLAQALALVLLGGFEGWVVGMLQQRVLQGYVPALAGWTRATVIGALCAWLLGMIPSTVAHLHGATGDAAAPDIGLPQRLALAAGLGLVAGPLLALFQWRRLRTVVPAGSVTWLPANAAAWALGMSVIFLTVHVAVAVPGAVGTCVAVALGLAVAGAVVGAVHGWAMARLLGATRA